MGNKARPSAFFFAAAYIALVVGLFLALGGAAYAQSPLSSSAADQYGDQAPAVVVPPTAVEVPPTAVEVPPTAVEVPPTAGGGDSGPAAGEQVGGVQVSATAGGGDSGPAVVESQALPNTGLSLLGVAVIGGALVASGLLLRRREQRKS